DLRQDIHLEDVDVQHIVGKNKASLSWIGVPMQTEHITGVIALASYRPNAFDRTTMELLENLTQHAALALNNAYHHEEVEEQSHIDSLTGAYNHGHFLKILERHAEDAQINNNRLSLIMLDVDYFKQYNDAYGHLAGDEILTLLVKTIRRYIKRTDTVGRWGGEEFAIALPNTNGLQATLVAERVRETMTRLTITAREKENIPVPTVSQGIAVFPDEADKIFALIDLADQRLYVAKGRGRNQIEPGKSHWQHLKTDH
ncbi:MAG: GGDEF domain-containing protein, partial [Chloroflexi bacterium]|nr:GGDEF domain-containing protein [Chloroflexota bacterium]